MLMLIPLQTWYPLCHVPIRGVIHIGAHIREHQCE